MNLVYLSMFSCCYLELPLESIVTAVSCSQFKPTLHECLIVKILNRKCSYTKTHFSCSAQWVNIHSHTLIIYNVPKKVVHSMFNDSDLIHTVCLDMRSYLLPLLLGSALIRTHASELSPLCLVLHGDLLGPPTSPPNKPNSVSCR